jgi:cytochrome c biogenesis protein CcdA/thiol-disulfide isomerase/thioredoxin
MLLFLIAFIAGVLTVLAPCVLPLLPVIVGGSVSGGVNKARAYTVAFSLGASVILFTLLLKFSTIFINIPQYAYEWFSGSILVLFGIVTLFPQIWDSIGLVNTVSRESNKVMSAGFMKQSFWGDILVGAALGPVFSTCSPTYFVILATVLPASFAAGFADLLAYTFGLVLMLLFVSLVGQKIVDKLGLAADPRGWFRKIIAVLFIIVGVLVFSGAEAPLEAWLITHVYDVTQIEQQLLQLRGGSGTLPMPTLGETQGSAATTTPTSTSSQQTAAAISDAQKAMRYPKAPELASIDGYINTGTGPDGKPKPITISQFKGKDVVLVDFWTYSCINCQRSLPYVEAWYQKYKDQGLVIIGVSTPEFAFEHVYANVLNATKQLGITYPVVLDNEYGTWNAFSNEYWPRDYLVDIDGYIVHDHAGEGDYDVTEKAIQAALAERAQRLGTGMPATGITAPTGVVTVDSGQLGSPETYFGSNRNEYLGNGTQGQVGVQNFTVPTNVTPNTFYLGGSWDIEPEYAQSQGSDTLKYEYQAKNVYFVSGTASGAPMDVEVTRDGKPLDASYAGKDIIFKNGKSYVTISGNRLYDIISDTSYGDHVLEFIISSPGLQAYTFTFG